jgi:hypothetical protein
VKKWKKSVKSEKITEIGTPTTTRRHHKIWHHQPLPFPDTDNYTKISTSQNFNFTPLQNFRRFHSIAILEFFFSSLFHLLLFSRQKLRTVRETERKIKVHGTEIVEIVPRVMQVYISIALSRQVIEYIIEFHNIESSQGKNSACATLWQ